MGTIERWGGGVVEFLAGGLLLVIVLITLAEVTIRYVVGGSLAWGEEVALLLWVWMIQLGAIRATHMRIDYLLLSLPARPAAVLQLVLDLVAIGLLAVLTWGAVQLIELTKFDRFVALPWLPVNLSYYAVVIGAPLWMVAIAARRWRSLRKSGD
jgi:TRAP-type C4-dicarboxylate transport system permease small subunit